MFLVISTSLNPSSRSRILAEFAQEQLAQSAGGKSRLIDLAQLQLPACDASECYNDPRVVELAGEIAASQGVLLATPVYNYSVSSSAKLLVELTGKAWTDKVVGFLCAAGGAGSYMACMGLANSLMLDFRTLVLPRFVYASGEAFAGDSIAEVEIEDRIKGLVKQLMAVSRAIMHPD